MNGVWVATMHSENFDWVAVGKTEDEALNAIAHEWSKSKYREPMSLEELKEYYGIYCRVIEFGQCEWN